ncbi:unnamed protein product [Didymodactylos carnosus]|uniref:Uncharacterized protein n=1 Tax=Didymodactylos carnosus TaxID=1234261 RepID=A0A814DKF6_9BILA|nr:unnamed protein product [Didymodactylos carnosus]CAF0958324.1 unnamed protein product [Didymodactylos carnosus]CAF3721845.1 unnamed protein product [Didymodactylos carnosus]CAF3733192.1 unnamed protein product [Didymodactylos carnosus]
MELEKSSAKVLVTRSRSDTTVNSSDHPKRRFSATELAVSNPDIPSSIPRFTNAKLRELAFAHLPPKRYKTNEAAKEFSVEIDRLPINHCILNPIELYIAALDDCSAFIERARKPKMTFRAADNFLEEEVEPHLNDEEQNHDYDGEMLSEDDLDATSEKSPCCK